jgi:hypothetical protein
MLNKLYCILSISIHIKYFTAPSFAEERRRRKNIFIRIVYAGFREEVLNTLGREYH